MKFTREEYLDLMTFGAAERPMFVELFGLLSGLEEEWREQGASQEQLDLIAFDWDYVQTVPCGGRTWIRNGFPPKKMEETREHIIQRDELGRTMKLNKKFASIPLPLDYPVKDFESWLKVKPLLTFHGDRIHWEQVDKAKKAQALGALVVANMPGGFDSPRELMGVENACLAYYLQPDLMHDIMDTITDTAFRTLDAVSNELVIDQLSVHEDMAGKSGPLIGPKQIQEFIQPYYQKIWGLLSDRGTRLFDMDSDGDMTSVLDLFLECGLNSMHPFESAAGMDIVALRKKYGNRLAMRGGIDKYALQKGKDAIQRELEYKMQTSVFRGGMAFGLDHRIPNGVSLENYLYYVNLGRKLLGKPQRSAQQKGWSRMAF